MDQNRRRLAANTTRLDAGRELHDHYQILEKVYIFKYIGWALSFDDSYWTALVRNLQIYRRKWGRFYRLLGREGGDTRASERFYAEVVQSTLIFGSESWVIRPRILRESGSLNKKAMQPIYVWITW